MKDDLEIWNLDDLDFEKQIVADTEEAIIKEETEEYYEGEDGIEYEEYYEDEDGVEYEEYYEDEDGVEYEEYYEDEDGVEYEEYYEDEDRIEYEEYYEDEDGLAYEDDVEYADEYYEDELLLENLEEEEQPQRRIAAGGFLGKIKAMFAEGSGMDLIIAATGILVVAIGIVTALAWGRSAGIEEQVQAMATVGESLGSVNVVGESALLAVQDAYVAMINSKPTEAEENLDNIQVTVSFTSLEKDLKIKFLNKETGELVKGVPFKVELTDSKNKTTTLIDENQDGIIYETKMRAGTYKVVCLSIGGFKFPTQATDVKVKDKIEYQKIYIADEVKKESEINVALEDSKKEEVTVEESKLTDTVEWVASSKTPVNGEGEYVKTDKKNIPDPSATASRMGGFYLMNGLGVTIANAPAAIKTDDTGTLQATITEGYTQSSIEWTSSDSGVVEIDKSSGAYKAIGKGEATITVKVTATKEKEPESTTPPETETKPSEPETTPPESSSSEEGSSSEGSSSDGGTSDGDLSGGDSADSEPPVPSTPDARMLRTARETVTETATATCKITVSAKDVLVTGIALSADKTSLKVGDTAKVTATVTPEGATNKAVNWSSSDETIATVSTDGTVTAKAEGNVKIKAEAADGSKVTAEIEITVGKAKSNVTKLVLEDNEKDPKISIKVGEKRTIKAVVSGDEGCEKGIDWSLAAGGNDYIKLGTDGSVEGIKVTEKPIVITATTKGTTDAGNKLSKTIEVTVTKADTTVTLNKTELTLLQGNSETLTATVKNNSNTSVAWSSKDGKIATVDKAGKVTAVAVGTTEIYAKSADGITATCKVTVKKNASADKTTKLKDKNGNQVYVKENGKYREAVYADYYTGKEFFIRGNVTYKYTGWQTLDNKTYYFDKNGNKVTGEQVIQGVKYNFTGDGILSMGNGTLGIDVSRFNGNINWQAVKNSGVSYVIIRCGYRGYSTGVLVEDSKFRSNIQGATAAGLKVGVYFVTQAVNEVEAVQEASMVLDLIKSYKISYPVFIDIERSGGRGDNIDKATRTAVANAFCATIQNNGYKAGIYANKDWFNNKMNASQLSAYKIWLAQYATKPSYSGRYDIWQYTAKGAIGGINGHVDLNTSYLGY